MTRRAKKLRVDYSIPSEEFAAAGYFIPSDKSLGLFALYSALDVQAGTARLASQFGAASTTATLALYGAVLAVDGVALKQAVNAWMAAPDAEKAARFAAAETMRWLEWGTRSYANFTLSLAVLSAARCCALGADTAPNCLPARTLGPHVSDAGMAGRRAGVLAGAHVGNHRRRNPERCLDDVAARIRREDATFRVPVASSMKVLSIHS